MITQIATHDILADQYPPLLTIRQASEITAIPEGTWRNWMQTGQCPVPTVKLRKAVRIRTIDLANWIDAGTATTPRRRRGRPKKNPFTQVQATE